MVSYCNSVVAVKHERSKAQAVAHLAAESVEDARKQWCDVFGRDRADLGPAHAREAAAEAIDRYGPMKPSYSRRSTAAPRRPAPEPTYRPPAQMSAPELGL